ncbi:MAG TPA: O-methyltransferase [Candidatus Tyrphobacter sp.]
MNESRRYLEDAHPQPNPLVVEVEQRSVIQGVPTISRETGRFLATLVHAMQANRILEIGTGYGGATLWMALAQPPAGRIWTIDPDVAHTDIARLYFERAGEAGSIEVLNQPAIELLETFPQRNLDIVFISADPLQYREFLDLAVPTLKRSGLIVFEHCLRGGSVAHAFNAAFLAHPDLAATILPLGDGVGVGARIR